MKQQTKNAIYGLAIGDATAYPYEFFSAEKSLELLQKKNYNYMEPNERLLVSDDTQMSIYLLNAFFEWKENSTNRNVFINYAADHFLKWYEDPRNDRAPGNACMTSMRHLKKLSRRNNEESFVSSNKDAGELNIWGHNYAKNSMGSGTVMRSPWLGLLHAEGLIDLEELLFFNQKQSILTHGHKGAEDSAIFAAVITSQLVTQGYKGKEQIFGLFRTLLDNYQSEEMEKVYNILIQIPDEWFTSNIHEDKDIDKFFPSQWTGPYVLGSALAILIATAGNPEAMMKRCMINNQDSDTIGAVTGALLGAASKDPHLWNNLENNLESDYLQELQDLTIRFDRHINHEF